MHTRPPTISISVRGREMRFASKKYFGKVWNRSHTSGAVNIWQDIERAIISHMRLTGRKRSFFGPAEGYQSRSIGKSVKVPSMARYDS